MKRSGGAASAWAILLGLFLLVEGVWGLKSPVVFGLLTTNWLHACIHILLGLIGLASGLRGGGRGFCLVVGWLLLLVGVLYFVPVATEFVTPLLNLSVYAAGLNIVVGLMSLIIARISRRAVVVVERR
jgi:hypothetical protein